MPSDGQLGIMIHEIYSVVLNLLFIFLRRNQTLFLAKVLLSVNRLCLGERKMKGTAQVEEVSLPFTDSWNLQNYLHFLDVPRILSDFSSVRKLHVLRSL